MKPAVPDMRSDFLACKAETLKILEFPTISLFSCRLVAWPPNKKLSCVKFSLVGNKKMRVCVCGVVLYWVRNSTLVCVCVSRSCLWTTWTDKSARNFDLKWQNTTPTFTPSWRTLHTSPNQLIDILACVWKRPWKKNFAPWSTNNMRLWRETDEFTKSQSQNCESTFQDGCLKHGKKFVAIVILWWIRLEERACHSLLMGHRIVKWVLPGLGLLRFLNKCYSISFKKKAWKGPLSEKLFFL